MCIYVYNYTYQNESKRASQINLFVYTRWLVGTGSTKVRSAIATVRCAAAMPFPEVFREVFRRAVGEVVREVFRGVFR